MGGISGVRGRFVLIRRFLAQYHQSSTAACPHAIKNMRYFPTPRHRALIFYQGVFRTEQGRLRFRSGDLSVLNETWNWPHFAAPSMHRQCRRTVGAPALRRSNGKGLSDSHHSRHAPPLEHPHPLPGKMADGLASRFERVGEWSGLRIARVASKHAHARLNSPRTLSASAAARQKRGTHPYARRACCRGKLG